MWLCFGFLTLMIKHLVGGYMWLNNDVLGSGIYSLCFEVEFDIRGITNFPC